MTCDHRLDDHLYGLLEEKRSKKAEQRGRFDEGIVLERVEE